MLYSADSLKYLTKITKRDGADNEYHPSRKAHRCEDDGIDWDTDDGDNCCRHDCPTSRCVDRMGVCGQLRDKRTERRKRQKEIDGTGGSIHRRLGRLLLRSDHNACSADSCAVRSLKRTAARKPRLPSSGLSFFFKQTAPTLARIGKVSYPEAAPYPCSRSGYKLSVSRISVSIAQRIERRPPKPEIEVRFLMGTPARKRTAIGIVARFCLTEKKFRAMNKAMDALSFLQPKP